MHRWDARHGNFCAMRLTTQLQTDHFTPSACMWGKNYSDYAWKIGLCTTSTNKTTCQQSHAKWERKKKHHSTDATGRDPSDPQYVTLKGEVQPSTMQQNLSRSPPLYKISLEQFLEQQSVIKTQIQSLKITHEDTQGFKQRSWGSWNAYPLPPPLHKHENLYTCSHVDN